MRRLVSDGHAMHLLLKIWAASLLLLIITISISSHLVAIRMLLLLLLLGIELSHHHLLLLLLGWIALPYSLVWHWLLHVHTARHLRVWTVVVKRLAGLRHLRILLSMCVGNLCLIHLRRKRTS